MIKYIYPFVWLGLIVFASLTPADKIPDFQLFAHADKVIHFCMYYGLAFLLVPVLLFKKNYYKSYILSLIISAIIGFLMEYFQLLMTHGRSADFYDFLSDLAGSIIGIVIYHFTFRNKIWEKRFFKIE